MKIMNIISQFHKSTLCKMECFKAMKNNIQFLSKNNNIKSILVTSTNDGEGKTTIAVNLGVTLSKEGKKVLIVDGNYPPISEDYSSLPETYISETPIKNLYIFSYSKYVDKNFGIERLAEIMRSLKQSYDFIIIDSPSADHISVVQDLSQYADSSILIIKPGQTEIAEAKKLIKQLTKLNVNIMGAILNKNTDLDYSEEYAVSDSYDKLQSKHKLKSKLKLQKAAYASVQNVQAK